MKQYSVSYNGVWIEMTGYYDSVKKVRNFLKLKYGKTDGLTFQAVYPKIEKRIYKA